MRFPYTKEDGPCQRTKESPAVFSVIPKYSNCLRIISSMFLKHAAPHRSRQPPIHIYAFYLGMQDASTESPSFPITQRQQLHARENKTTMQFVIFV